MVPVHGNEFLSEPFHQAGQNAFPVDHPSRWEMISLMPSVTTMIKLTSAPSLRCYRRLIWPTVQNPKYLNQGANNLKAKRRCDTFTNCTSTPWPSPNSGEQEIISSIVTNPKDSQQVETYWLVLCSLTFKSYDNPFYMNIQKTFNEEISSNNSGSPPPLPLPPTALRHGEMRILSIRLHGRILAYLSDGRRHGSTWYFRPQKIFPFRGKVWGKKLKYFPAIDTNVMACKYEGLKILPKWWTGEH